MVGLRTGTPRPRGVLFGTLLASVILLSCLGSDANAQLIRLFGDERVGTSAGQFLRVPAGARGIAMGGGMSASIVGAAAPFWNPAGMRVVQRGSGRVFLSHMEYPAEIDVDHISFVKAIGPWQLGLSGGVLRSGEILRTTELHPNGAGITFEANQFVVGVSLGRILTDRFAFAGTVKLFQENLDEFENRGVFLDLGALYSVGFGGAKIGFTVRNFGTDLRLNGTTPEGSGLPDEWQSFPAPTLAIFGFSYDLGIANQRLTMTLDFSHPSDDIESVIMGSELALWERLFLRSGYRSDVEDGGISAGFGLHLLEGAKTMRFGYAYDDRGNFGGLHIVSLELGR